MSFDGPITFSNDYDEIIKAIPIESIMAETDSPFAAPTPFRGKRCEPQMVKEIIKRIAILKELPEKDINDIMYHTGDVGIYDENKNLVYISRKDFQIKHMGHRIELGEIDKEFTSNKIGTKIVILNIEDKYKYFQPELIEILKNKTEKYFNY